MSYIHWNHKAVKKLHQVDVCSFGELWECQLLIEIKEEIELYGGKILWFFFKVFEKRMRKFSRKWGLGTALNCGSNYVGALSAPTLKPNDQCNNISTNDIRIGCGINFDSAIVAKPA